MRPTLSQSVECAIATPFTIALPGNAKELICKRVVRCLPGKRRVCLATWGDEQVVAKLFLSTKHAKRHWLREESGARALLDRGILAPPLLYSGPIPNAVERPAREGISFILIFKRIAPALTLAEAWGTANDDKRWSLVRSLVRVLAAHHRAGLAHRDMHFGNFLVQGEDIFTLDGDQVDVLDAPLNKRRALKNLGLLFAQLLPEYDRFADQVFPEYLALRDWGESKADRSHLHAAIRTAREYRENKFLKKIFRESSAFICHSNAQRFTVYDRAYDSAPMRHLLRDPDDFLESVACKLVKRGNTATVGIVNIDGHALIIKRYNIKSFRHGCNRALRRSRAALSWRNAHLLNLYGIPTSAPIALIERRLGPLRRTSYFINAYVEGVDCGRYFSAESAITAQDEEMSERLSALIGKMARGKISHGDMKATNIIISRGEPVLVDLDGLRRHRFQSHFKKAFARDIRRFLKNWDKKSAIRHLFESRLSKLLTDH